MKGVKIMKNSPVQFGEAQTPRLLEKTASSSITLQRKTLFGDRLLH